MSLATVYGLSQFGLADEATASGLYLASFSLTGTSETVEAPDHIGCTVGIGIYNPKKDISASGIIKTKATGLAGNIGTIIDFVNPEQNGRTRLIEGLGASISATGSSVIITGNSIEPSATVFEGGGLTGIYLPFVVVANTVALT